MGYEFQTLELLQFSYILIGMNKFPSHSKATQVMLIHYKQDSITNMFRKFSIL